VPGNAWAPTEKTEAPRLQAKIIAAFDIVFVLQNCQSPPSKIAHSKQFHREMKSSKRSDALLDVAADTNIE
jgi:hypothetical protein